MNRIYKYYSFLIVVILILNTDACIKFPNNTESTFNWWECQGGTVTISSINFYTKGGSPEYPLNLKNPIYISIQGENHGSPFRDLRLDISVWTFGGWEGCRWHKLPTFGLLSNLNGCEYGVPCPVHAGKISITAEIDLSKDKTVLSFLKNDSPYQIEYHITERNTGEKICVMAQARCLA